MRRPAGLGVLETALIAACLGGILAAARPALASGGSGGGGGGTAAAETVKVGKCTYADTGAYVELLISASSSNASAHLYAFLPSGQLLGEVQNGGGGRYGGTVFVTLGIPATITVASTSGAFTVAPTVPFGS